MVGNVSRLPYMMPEEVGPDETAAKTYEGGFWILIQIFEWYIEMRSYMYKI